MVPWTHESVPKQHLNQFSRFCTAHPSPTHRQTDTQAMLRVTSITNTEEV